MIVRPLMKTLVGLLGFIWLLKASLFASEKVVFVSGEFEYKSAESLPDFVQWLKARYPLNCVYLEREEGNHIPGLEAIKEADLLVVFIRRMTLPEEELKVFQDYVASGRPLIGIRTASHAFENWTEFDADVLKGNYQKHHGNNLKTTVKVVDTQIEHPLLREVSGWLSEGSLYKNTPLQDGATVLMQGSVEGHPSEPVTWYWEKGIQRVFYTSLGHPADFKEDSFQTLMTNSLYWALGKEPPIPVARGKARRVDVEEFDRFRNQAQPVILDVRTADEFKDGHIPGAVNLDFFGKDFAEQMKTLDREQTYLIHCAAGGRSWKACSLLDELGFQRVIELQPGFRGWKEAGKATVLPEQ